MILAESVSDFRLGGISHPLITSLWGALVATLVLSMLLPGNWQPVGAGHLGSLIALILLGGISQTIIVFAFARAKASTLAPFTYLEIVAAVLIGLLIFGTLPNWVSWFGIGFIVIGGLIVARSLPATQTD